MKPFILFKTLLIFLFLGSCISTKKNINHFVNLKSVIPEIEIDLRYYGRNNFIGRPVQGYHKPIAYLTMQATQALKLVQNSLRHEGLGLKVFDAYRPQRSVDHFKSWALEIQDTLGKKEFYPDIDKRNLFKLGYIAEKSGHSRGSTIDLTIINLNDKSELDMGSVFDFFGKKSHHDYSNLTDLQKKNRKKLKTVMEKYGFVSYPEEWWHYTLKDEPFTNKYFNYPIQ